MLMGSWKMKNNEIIHVKANIMYFLMGQEAIY